MRYRNLRRFLENKGVPAEYFEEYNSMLNTEFKYDRESKTEEGKVKDYEARELFDCGCDKSAEKKLDDCNKCYDIAAAYEARAERIKEQK